MFFPQHCALEPTVEGYIYMYVNRRMDIYNMYIYKDIYIYIYIYMITKMVAHTNKLLYNEMWAVEEWIKSFCKL